MRNLLLAAVLSLAGPACAEEAKPAPAAAAPAANSPADMAKLRAVLQQLQARSEHFEYVPPSDSAVVTGYSRVLPAKNVGGSQDAVSDEGGVVVAGRGRQAPGEKAQIRITDQLRDYLGIDTGPVGVGVRGKTIVFSIKY